LTGSGGVPLTDGKKRKRSNDSHGQSQSAVDEPTLNASP
jgi:hypothetical protein